MPRLFIFSLITVAVFLFDITAYAHYFDERRLIRVVYDREGTYEVATDLGPLSELLDGEEYVVGGGANAFTPINDVSRFGNDAEWANLYVAYFAKEYDGSGGNNDAWVSGSEVKRPGCNPVSWVSLSSASDVIFAYWRHTGDAQTVQAEMKGNVKSYYNSMIKAGVAPGAFADFIYSNEDRAYSEANLALLAPGGLGYVEQMLYFWDDPGGAESYEESLGVPYLKLKTMADGSTIVSPVPIPGAFLLLASGLVAIIGIRKRSFKK